MLDELSSVVICQLNQLKTYMTLAEIVYSQDND